MSESSALSRIKRLVNAYSGLVLMGAVGIPIGVIVGAVCALFGRVLLAIGIFRDEHIALLLPFLALMGLAIVFAYRTWGKGTDRGMSLVFDVGHGREDAISPRLVPLVMLSAWGTHLFGGSAEREGVAVQIGATISHWIGRRLPFRDPGNTFLRIGMAAGFAGLFRTPLAATVFAIEVLVAGRMEYRALFPTLGYAAVFGSATNTLLAPILIGCEVFGFGNLPAFFIVCVVAYLFNMDIFLRPAETGVERCPSRWSQPETASRSEAVFRDTVSAWDAIRKAHPALKRNSGTWFPSESPFGQRVPFFHGVLAMQSARTLFLVRALKPKQPLLAIKPAGISVERTIGGNYAMAWHDDRNGITRNRSPHRTRRHNRVLIPRNPMAGGDTKRNLAIRSDLATWN